MFCAGSMSISRNKTRVGTLHDEEIWLRPCLAFQNIYKYTQTLLDWTLKGCYDFPKWPWTKICSEAARHWNARLGIWMKVEHLYYVLWLVLVLKTIYAVITLLLTNLIKMFQQLQYYHFWLFPKIMLVSYRGRVGRCVPCVCYTFAHVYFRHIHIHVIASKKKCSSKTVIMVLLLPRAAFPQFLICPTSTTLLKFLHVLPNWANNTIDCGLYLLQVKTQDSKNIKWWTSTWICSTEPKKNSIVWSRAWLETCQAARADPVALGRIIFKKNHAVTNAPPF